MKPTYKNIGPAKWSFLALSMVMLFAMTFKANALTTLTVEGSDDSAGTEVISVITDYRWMIEEYAMHNIVPGQSCQPGGAAAGAECLSTEFHRSYMPVVAEGRVVGGVPVGGFPALDPTKRYHISVLPDVLPDPNAPTYSMGGSPIEPGQEIVTVRVNKHAIDTAQIRVYVFHDNSPINNAPDLPQESDDTCKFCEFSILLEDAGGRYGNSAQFISTDVFGNPLGTTYDAGGNVLTMGDGVLHPDANGYVVIKNISPAKYGIVVVPPTGSGWVQTSTIEGKHVIDAWVKAREPSYFAEFGPPGPHVFVGFIQQFTDTTVLNAGATISGQVHSIHNSRPPDFAFYTGAPVPGCWVGLNEMVGGLPGRGLFAAPCDGDSNFSIPNVPAGTYSLSIWDANLDYIFAQQAVTVAADLNGVPQDVSLLDVPVFAWFARIEQNVFNDENEDGIWNGSEVGMLEQGTGIRWRDGTIYQEFPTDSTGAAPYDEVFPFFSWLVAESGYARFKATGVTVTVDAGGPVNPGEVLNPQPQPENGGLGNRTETGPVLTQAFQAFLGQTNILDWGRKPYVPGENGGISGIVFYAMTRAEDDPRLAGPELWEPGIPRIQVALYQDNVTNATGVWPPDGIIDDINGEAGIQIADVDNYPYGFAEGAAPGPEDFDYNLNGTFDNGDAIQITYTDSWDDAPPSGCVNDTPFYDADGNPIDCYDGLRNFNQVRGGVFDGGYAFSTIPNPDYDPAIPGSQEELPMPAGMYIVGTGEHPVYKTIKEEDRNVDFGDVFSPAPQLLPPVCVGNVDNGQDPHVVPMTFSLFDSGDMPYRAGEVTPVCDLKQVQLSDGQNAAADFFLFTEVPIAGHIVGFILDDASNEFDPASPQFGEKYSPPYVPVSIRDFKGHEIARTYSDRWGRFNALVPSTFTNNLPTSSGVSPAMVTTCMNDPGPIPDGNGGFKTDPFYKPQYSLFCYTFQYMPGSTTYLDTPVVPVAAFAGPDQFALDCALPTGTPVIANTMGSLAGPFVTAAGNTLTITSVQDPTNAGGLVSVPNPQFGAPGEPQFILRDFGFGATPGTVTINGAPVTVNAWTDETIEIVVPASGHLAITTAAGVSTETGIYVTVGGTAVTVAPGGSIQQAIDLANPGDLVLVPAGTYEEMVIMDKPVKLQGSGASTVINAVNAPAEKLQTWYNSIESRLANFDLLPGQELGFALPEPTTLFTEAGAGIVVLGRNTGPNGSRFNATTAPRIDGFSVTGADNGGGITVNGYAHTLEISNNRVFGNYGVYGGGIRVGHPVLTNDGVNNNLRIHDNYVAANGGNTGAGGGVSLNRGTDNYQLISNYICGNFTGGNGGGVAHYGRSNNGLIANNTIIFNQSFQQTNPVSGGGILVGGVPGAAGALTVGSGNVRIEGNLIQGNNAAAGNGGGIALASTSGTDTTPGNPNQWNWIRVYNNIIVNNVAGFAAGGISLQDAARVDILHNTIAHNDSTATSGEAFCDTSVAPPVCDPNMSFPRAAGVVSFAHSAALEDNMSNSPASQPYHVFSNPLMNNNIIFENRSFWFAIDPTTVPETYGLYPDPSTPMYDDLAVYGAPGVLTSTNDIVTGEGGTEGGDDLFITPQFNGGAGQTINQVELTTTIQAQPAFDEGGNFINVRYGPLTPGGDYHIEDGSTADGSGAGATLPNDFDGEPRPQGGAIDIGADERL